MQSRLPFYSLDGRSESDRSRLPAPARSSRDSIRGSHLANDKAMESMTIQFPVRTDAGQLTLATVTDILTRTPEADLALAVLVDAVLCYRKYAWSTLKPKRHLFREAQRWLTTDASCNSRFTCGFICDSLGIDRVAVADALRTWRSQEHIRRARTERRGMNLAHLSVRTTGDGYDGSETR